MFRASRHVPRGLAFTPATAHISTAPSCKDDPVKNDTNKKTFRRPQQEDLVDTRRNVRERIGERPRSAEIMTPLGGQLFLCVGVSTALIAGPVSIVHVVFPLS